MSGDWNGTTLYSKIHKTKDESSWPEVGSAKNSANRRVGRKREIQKHRMRKEKAIWGDFPAQPPKKDSSIWENVPEQPPPEEDEIWGSFRVQRPKKEKETGNGSDSFSNQTPLNQDNYWGEVDIPGTPEDSTDQPPKTEDVIWSDTSPKMEDVIWGDNSPGLPTTHPKSFVSLEPIEPAPSIVSPRTSTTADPMQIEVRGTGWSFEAIQVSPTVQIPPSPPSNTTSKEMEPTTPSFSLLLSLPTELQLSIIDLLPPYLKLLLRLTCHHLHTLIPPPTLPSLLSAEQTPWARTRHLWTCATCLRLRHTRHFADTMVRGPRGLNGKEPHKRFCVECGLRADPITRASRYAPGSEIIVNGCRHVFCRECRVYGRELGGEGTGVCKGCHVMLGLWGGVRGVQTGVNPGRERRARRGWRRGVGWWGGGDPYGYESEGLEGLDGYDTGFWESYDPSY